MNITNNTNSLSVTTPPEIEQAPSTALAVLNVTSTTQQPETLATGAHTNATVFDPATWNSLAQNLAQGQPSTPIAQPQTTTAGRRQQTSEASTEGEPRVVRRRVRRTATVTAQNCKAAGDLIIKKKGNDYQCLKLSEVFPTNGVNKDPTTLLPKDKDYGKIKDQFDNSTESEQIHAEVLQRMVMTTKSALKADEKWRWQFHLSNSTFVDKDILGLSNLTRLLGLDNEEFPDNLLFFNSSDPAQQKENSTSTSYRPMFWNVTQLPANRTCADNTTIINFDVSKENKGPSQVYSNYTRWLTKEDAMWKNLRDRPLLDVFMIGLASGMSLVSIILLLTSCIRFGKRVGLVDRLQNIRDREARTIKVRLEQAKRQQEERDNETRQQEARELGVLGAFNRYRFTDRRNYFSDKEIGIAALNAHHHQSLVQQADDAFAQTQNPTDDSANGAAGGAADGQESSPQPWTQRYLLPESAFEQGLDVPPPAYSVVDFIAAPVVGPIEANERFDLVAERRHLRLVQEKLKAVRSQREILESKIFTQDGQLSPTERRRLRELQTAEGDLQHDRRSIERSIQQLENQMVQRAYDTDADGVTLLEMHPEAVLSRAAVMPARSDVEIELDKALLAEQLQDEELPSYFEATQESHRPARGLLDMHASIQAIKAQKELEQKQQLKRRILASAANFDMQAEQLLDGTLTPQVAAAASDDEEDKDSTQTDEQASSEVDASSALALSKEDQEALAEIRNQLKLLQESEDGTAIAIDIPAGAEAEPLLAGQSSAITDPSQQQGGTRPKTTIRVSGGKTVSKKDKEQEKREEEAQRLAHASANEARGATQEGVRHSLRHLIAGSVETRARQEISAGTIADESQKTLDMLIAQAYDTGQAPAADGFIENLVNDIEQTVTKPWQQRMEQAIDIVLNDMLPDDPNQARAYLNDKSRSRKLNQRLAAAAAQVLQEQITPGITPETVNAMLDTISQAMLNSLTLGEAQALMQMQLEEAAQRIAAQSDEQTSNDYYEKMMSLQKSISAKMATHAALHLSSQEIKHEIEETHLNDPITQASAVEASVLATNPRVIAARERRVVLPSERIRFYQPPPLEDEPKPHATQQNSQLERELLDLKSCQLAAIASQTAVAEERLADEEQQQIALMVGDRITAEAARLRRLERERAREFAAKIPEPLKPQAETPLSSKSKDVKARAQALTKLNFGQPAPSSTAQPPSTSEEPTTPQTADQAKDQPPKTP